MVEIMIPGDELEELAQSLGKMLELIDQKTPPFMTEKEVGYPLMSAGQRFDQKWSDGRFRLRREAEALKKAADEILLGFKKTDEDLGNSLTPDGSGGNGGNSAPDGKGGGGGRKT